MLIKFKLTHQNLIVISLIFTSYYPIHINEQRHTAYQMRFNMCQHILAKDRAHNQLVQLTEFPPDFVTAALQTRSPLHNAVLATL